MDLELEYFVSNGIYLLKNHYDCIFVCLTTRSGLGKLVQYRKQSETMYEKTTVSYLIKYYEEDDVQSVFVDRENYEMIGRIGLNFKFSDDERNYILRRNNAW